MNRKKEIKIRLLESFPDFYGRFLLSHFAPYLDIKIESKEQEAAYIKIIDFLDKVEFPSLSEEVLEVFEESFDFWTEERLVEVEENKTEAIENPREYLEVNEEVLSEYLAYKETDDFKNSAAGELMNIMKCFAESSGYNEVFIPAMMELSPKYRDYQEKLLKANEEFLKFLDEK